MNVFRTLLGLLAIASLVFAAAPASAAVADSAVRTPCKVEFEPNDFEISVKLVSVLVDTGTTVVLNCLSSNSTDAAAAGAIVADPCSVSWDPDEFELSVRWISVTVNDGADVVLDCLKSGSTDFRA